MFDYLQKFNSLSKDLRDRVSTPTAMAVIENLEKKYGVALAAVIMKVMVKDIVISDLVGCFINEFKLEREVAQQLARELNGKIFIEAADYLDVKKGAKNKEDKKDKEADIEQKISDFSLKPEAPLKSSEFFFSPEDEEEIKELTQKITKFKELDPSESKIDGRLNRIIFATGINFGSELLVKRFKQIISTYLRGIRDQIETKQTLIKSFGEGGLDFDEESASKVLAISESSIKDLNKVSVAYPVKIKLPKDDSTSFHLDSKKGEAGKETDNKLASLKSIGVRDVDYDLSKIKEVKTKDQYIKKLDVGHELAPPPPSLRRTSPHPPAINKKVEVPTIPQAEYRDPDSHVGIRGLPVRAGKKLTPKLDKQRKKEVRSEDKMVQPQTWSAKLKIQVRKPSETGYKKKIEDVKYVPRIMNPIDELRYLDLVSFRRLAPNPREIVEKIKEKISLLEEDQYSKRIEGIKAWRRSPANKLYLQIGQQSISKGKPIDAIIEERKKASQDYLTNDEFEAIMDLNKSLRF